MFPVGLSLERVDMSNETFRKTECREGSGV